MTPVHPDSLRQRLFAIGAILVVSAIYYSRILDAGFNSTDDGNFAQICYELLLGRSPEDLALGYGLLWFKSGEALFRLFGVDYLLVRALFFTSIALTNVLVFCALLRASGRMWLAGALTGVTLLAPSFPATAFYGLCIALNAAAQMRMASRLSQTPLWDAALAGAALGLTFQIRPDFGFVFLAPLIVILAVQRVSWRVPTAAGIGFAVVSLPLFIFAAAGGYADVLVRQYLDYPALMIEFLVNGLHMQAGDQRLAILQRPGLATPIMMFLVYAPAAIIAAFGLFVLGKGVAWLRTRNVEPLAESLLALTAGVAAFPHYFLFRPDLSHVANFMPGFVILCGVFVARLVDAKFAIAWRTLASGAIAVTLVLYLWTGLTTEGTGSIAVAAGRTERFEALNGIDVRVSPGEKEQLEAWRDAILANSAPGAAIVCLPYCPGIAFMAGRRMLLDAFYADETFLVRRPEWLPAAIDRTRAARPLVLIADWAIHGTERSRFTVWAAAYVEAVGAMARERRNVGGATIYLLNGAGPAPE